MSLKGEDKIRRKLERLAKRMPDAVGRALYQEAEILKGKSMKRTPHDGGHLEGSHVVTQPEYSGRNISVTIGVGSGVAQAYALAVHETPSGHDPPSWRGVTVTFAGGRQSKFLESVVLEARPFLARSVAKRIELSRMV